VFKTKAVLMYLCSSLLTGFILAEQSYAAKTYKLPSGEVLHDPTRPHNWNRASGPKAKAEHFTLNYILKTAEQNKAIINGKKVTEGEFVSGAKVIKIQTNTVKILVNGKHKNLHLNNSSSVRKMKR